MDRVDTLGLVSPSVGVYAEPTWTVDVADTVLLPVVLPVSRVSCYIAGGAPANPACVGIDGLISAAEADLQVDIAESADPVAAGSGAGNLLHTVTLTNNGPDAASNVTVDLGTVLPAGVSQDGVAPSAGIYSPPNWMVDVAEGSSATFTITFTVGETTTPGTDVIQVDAAISDADQVLINLANDSASQATTVVRLSLDIDGDGLIMPLSDGLMIIRFIADLTGNGVFTGNALILAAVANGAIRTTAVEITEWLQLNLINGVLDADGNGVVELETDAVLLLRYLFGFEGQYLIDQALSDDASRDDPGAIEDHIERFLILDGGFE